MAKNIEFVIKPTLRCNGACSYCNVAETGSFMGKPVIEATFRSLAEYLGRNPLDEVTILWHGGEPTLMGEFFFQEVLGLQALISDHRVEHVMQSNLTCMTPALADTLCELLKGGGIGTSVDPFSDYRRLKSGEPYPERWYEGFELVRSRGFRVGMVYVVHGESVGLGKSIYHYFKNVGVDSLTLIPLEEPAREFEGARLDAPSWGKFLLEIYRAWEEDRAMLPVEPFVTWAHFAHDKDSPRCGFPEGLHCCEPTVAVAPTGDVYPCVRLLDVGSGAIGNLVVDSLEKILTRPDALWRSQRRDLLRQGECASCRWWDLCAGGCAAACGFGRKTVWCEGYRLFFEAVNE
ncbi:MAG: radical SAM protein [Deltaproteobacteria bacterium]|nr:radical SAM protein [Deltaproteobacteria bacterium]